MQPTAPTSSDMSRKRRILQAAGADSAAGSISQAQEEATCILQGRPARRLATKAAYKARQRQKQPDAIADSPVARIAQGATEVASRVLSPMEKQGLLRAGLSEYHIRYIIGQCPLLQGLFGPTWKMSALKGAVEVESIRLNYPFFNPPVASTTTTSSVLDRLPKSHPWFIWLRLYGRTLIQGPPEAIDPTTHRTYGLMLYYLQLITYLDQSEFLGSLSPAQEGRAGYSSVLLPHLQDGLSERLIEQMKAFYAKWRHSSQETSLQQLLSERDHQAMRWIYQLFTLGISEDRLLLALSKSTEEEFLHEMLLRVEEAIEQKKLRRVSEDTLLDRLLHLPSTTRGVVSEVDGALKIALEARALEGLHKALKGELDPDEAMRRFLEAFEVTCEQLVSAGQEVKDALRQMGEIGANFLKPDLTYEEFEALGVAYKQAWPRYLACSASLKAKLVPRSELSRLLNYLDRHGSEFTALLQVPEMLLDPRLHFTAPMHALADEMQQLDNSRLALLEQARAQEGAAGQIQSTIESLEKDIATIKDLLSENEQRLVKGTMTLKAFDGERKFSLSSAYSHLAELARQLEVLGPILELERAKLVQAQTDQGVIEKQKAEVERALESSRASFQQLYNQQRFTLHLKTLQPNARVFHDVVAGRLETIGTFERQVQQQRVAKSFMERFLQESQVLRQQDASALQRQRWELASVLSARVFETGKSSPPLACGELYPASKAQAPAAR